MGCGTFSQTGVHGQRCPRSGQRNAVGGEITWAKWGGHSGEGGCRHSAGRMLWMTCWASGPFTSTFQLWEGGGRVSQGSACSAGRHMAAARNSSAAQFWCQPPLSGDWVAVLLQGEGRALKTQHRNAVVEQGGITRLWCWVLRS